MLTLTFSQLKQIYNQEIPEVVEMADKSSSVEEFKLKMQRFLQEISVKSSENLSVADMAKFCGWSSSHFMRWFKKMTGDSFTSYVNDRRLAEAAEALCQTDDKILTIAQDAGFMNLSNFNRQFKKRYGVTPREYREMIGI